MNKAEYRHILSKLCTPIKFDEFIDSSIDTETRHYVDTLTVMGDATFCFVSHQNFPLVGHCDSAVIVKISDLHRAAYQSQVITSDTLFLVVTENNVLKLMGRTERNLETNTATHLTSVLIEKTSYCSLEELESILSKNHYATWQ